LPRWPIQQCEQANRLGWSLGVCRGQTANSSAEELPADSHQRDEWLYFHGAGRPPPLRFRKGPPAQARSPAGWTENLNPARGTEDRGT